MNDWGWCLFVCGGVGDAALCPAHPAGGTVDCVDWDQMGSLGCFLTCDINNPASCAAGSECSTVAGPPLCLYPADMF